MAASPLDGSLSSHYRRRAMVNSRWKAPGRILAVLLILGFAGCGGPSRPVPGPGPDAADTAPAGAAELATAAPTDAELRAARERVDADPSFDGYVNLSLEYYGAGRYRDSIEACEAALRLRPDHPIPYNNICCAHVELGEYDEAIAACERALQLAPDYERAKNNLAWARQKKQG